MQLLPPEEMERLDSMLADYPLSVILRGLQEVTLERVREADNEMRANCLRAAAQDIGKAAQSAGWHNV